MGKRRTAVLLLVVLFMLVALFFSSIISFSLKRPQLRSPALFSRPFTTNQFNHTMSDTMMPPFMYGTAWKKDRTKELVEMAIRVGFRGVDTACQPKHYYEPGVGEALDTLYAEGVVTRAGIFLQTKFTSLNGQDPNRIPYNPSSPLADQVEQSFGISLQNLRTTYLDSLVLHGPLAKFADTMTVWRAMEAIHDRGGARRIGISNCYDLRLLQQLYKEARVKPTVLQNRFYADTGYDEEIREFCRQNSITYQSFWTLTANPRILKS
jgi:diketogulonate reductase-like aldo/keto reductase